MFEENTQTPQKEGVVTSAHSFNHHFQGRGVKSNMGNDFLESSATAEDFSSAVAFYLIVYFISFAECHSLALNVLFFVRY